MRTPNVTLAVPIHNGAETIAETLDSAFAQTYRDFEVIVLDDGSTDGSAQIVEGYSDDRLRWLQFEHAGIGASFNRCIENARGRYLKILPQDDLLAPDCLAEMVNLLGKSAHPALAFCRRRVLHDPDIPWHREFMKKHAQPDDLLAPLGAINDGPSLLSRWAARNMIKRNLIGEPVATLFPVELARSIGGFSKALHQNLDYLFWIRLAARGDVCFSPQKLCTFRLRESGTSHQNILAGTLEFEKLRLLQELVQDSKVMSAIPQITALLEAERRKLCGLPWKKHLYFWKTYARLDELPQASRVIGH